MDQRLEEIKKCDKLINSFLLRGNKFVEYACFQYGEYNAAISGEPDAHYISDALQVRTNTMLQDMFPSEQRATLISVESFMFFVVMIILSPLAGIIFSYW